MIVLLAVAALLLAIAWLIKYRRVTWLISGYNTSSQAQKQRYDIEKLCRHVGNFVFLLGGEFLVMGLLIGTLPQWEEGIVMGGFGVLIVTLVAGIIYLNTGKRVIK